MKLFFKYIFLISFISFSSCAGNKENVKFAIASDFHAQDVPDGAERLSSFVQAACDSDVDFIIELGDFCRLDSSNSIYHEIWNLFDGEKYHVIGNHDLDAMYVSPSQAITFDYDEEGLISKKSLLNKGYIGLNAFP